MPLLTETKATLPSEWYYDAAHYERELEAIWYRDWVCVGRAEEIPNAGDFLVRRIGNQSLIVTRDKDDVIRAFHNTCRHRGSIICTSEKGHFPNGRIICPYHTWTYSLTGELVATPFRIDTDDFRNSDYALYDVHVDCWGGFIFVNLQENPDKSLKAFMEGEDERLANWPLEQMISVHQETKLLKCNWKLFWENYNECYHCPRHHPELCKVVPIYKKALQSHDELSADLSAGDPIKHGVADGLVTWTLDGQTELPRIEGLSDEDAEQGMVFASFKASMFVVGHPDYVRSVRIYPTGAETTDLVVDWYLMPGTKEKHADQIENMLELGRLVVEQDGVACDLNQQGLRSKAHEHGVLVAQEYWLWDFHEWIKSRLNGSTE
ncbi:MAG: aromatic ring-hydroxylating dioxygenase subunit alpha [Woeseiaceae bacterium]|nr:aromatic ring-hydroxylating dioxygenase subunit alpha [Woeseiaceae bacterium]